MQVSDFPRGWTARRGTDGWARCFDASLVGARVSARASSPAFSDSLDSVVVSLAVQLATDAQAKRIYRAAASGISRCYAALTPRAERVLVRPLSEPPAHVKTVAYRLVYAYGHQLPLVYLDLVLFQRSRIVELAYFGDLTKPFPARLERRLDVDLTLRLGR